MSLDLYEVMKSAYQFAGEMLLKPPLSIDTITTLRSKEVLASQYGQRLMDSVIAGAIFEYHNQLREELLKHGIDIGEMGPGFSET